MLHQLFQYEKEKFAELGGVKNVIFIDDTFTSSPRFKTFIACLPARTRVRPYRNTYRPRCAALANRLSPLNHLTLLFHR